MTAEPGWVHGRPLHEVREIPGVLSIAILDRVAATIVWSLAVDPAADVPGEADDVLRTVGAADRVVTAHDRLDAWSEVILISSDRCHLIRPFGTTERDGLIVHVVLDLRTVSLAGARHQLELLLEPYRSAPGSPPEAASPVTAAGLARRVPVARAPTDDELAGPSVGTLNQVLSGLRRLSQG